MEEARHRVIRELGAGGMGAVRLVHDAERQEEVAEKRIHATTPSALLRFKREFRVVERLLHPNLVRLYELGEDAAGIYFTMEAVDGVDLAAWCAGAGTSSGGSGRGVSSRVETIDSAEDATLPSSGPHTSAIATRTVDVDLAVVLPRLLHAMPQIVEALSFLHAHGVVHRDLKPANVMIDKGGVVKLLDFGVLAEPGHPLAGDEGAMIGTIGFMAPEQLRGAPAVPESDLYALGATLFTLLTGAPIFDGLPVHVIYAHLEREPPRLASIVSGVPDPIDELCARLLAKRPEDRADLATVSRLLASAGARSPVLAPPALARVDLFGRDALFAEVERALETSRLVVLSGASGAGKTAVAEGIADERARGGVLVLRGRGRQNDRLAFNAVDGAVDHLAMALGRQRKHPSEVESAIAAASLAFPVLGGERSTRGDESRDAVFDGVARLLEHVAGDGVLMLVDDLQWADLDSVQLLRHVVRSASANVSVLATFRDDVPPGPAAALFDEGESHALVIGVGALDGASLRRIAARAAADAGATPDDAALDDAAAAASGRPFLAELLGRSLGGKRMLDAVSPLAALARASVERDAALVAALLAADGWASLTELASVAEKRPGELDDRVRELAQSGVVRRAGASGPSGFVDVYHDSLRTALASVIPEAALARAHGQFADLLLGGAIDAPEERVVRHLVGAGRGAEAAIAARQAAEHALEKLAYGLAADMFGIAIAYGEGPSPDLLERRAQALERCGRYGDAVTCWDALARDAETSEDATLHAMSAAHALLAANRVSEGAERLSLLLGASGGPSLGRPSLRGYLAGAAFLLGWGLRREVRPLPPGPERDELAQRADVDVKLGLMVGYFDPMSGVRVLRRARDGFLRVGDAERIAWCDYLFACFADQGSSARKTPRLVALYRGSGDAISSAAGVSSARLAAVRRFLDGVAHMRSFAWDDATRELEASIGELEAVGLRGVFEQGYALSMLATVGYIRHDLALIRRVLGGYVRLVGERESAILSHERSFSVVAATFDGAHREAALAMARVREALPANVPTIQRAVATMLDRLPHLSGRPSREAPRPLDDEERALVSRYRLLQSNTGSPWASIAAMSEAQALRAGRKEASRARAERYVRDAVRAVPLAAGTPERALAYVEDARGRPDRALAMLRASEGAAEAIGRPVDAAISRFQRGLREGGDGGRDLCEAAACTLRDAGLSEELLYEDPALL